MLCAALRTACAELDVRQLGERRRRPEPVADVVVGLLCAFGSALGRFETAFEAGLLRLGEQHVRLAPLLFLRERAAGRAKLIAIRIEHRPDEPVVRELEPCRAGALLGTD